MPAFVCGQELFQDIVNYVFHNNEQFRFSKSKDVSNTAKKKLATRLWKMNVNAVCQRYDETPDRYKKPDWDFEDLIDTKKVFDKRYFTKRLCCLVCQCDEGNVPDMNLFKQLDAMTEQFLIEIGGETREEDPWD